ncbi:MAG TPA: DNA polymerase III subunit beta [Burkholderiales bacterium]|nr:DNA polymerase III subunit beta [Burkholderiales bacterium]
MLLKFKRDTLLKPVTLTTGFVEKKQSIPILSNVYINKSGDNITLIANDMEIQVSITGTSDIEGKDFVITLPAKKLQDILKAFPDDTDITFEQVSGKIILRAGRTKFTLQSLPAEHYPLLQIMDNVLSQFSISQTTLKALIGQIQYAMADKDSRVFLNGMLFEIKNNQLNLIATDAHRLGFATYPLSETISNSSSIIPRKTIIELYRLLEDTDEPVLIKIYPKQVSFETNNKQLITKVIEGKYPDYERVIPTHNDKLCIINREDLLRAVERVSVIGIDKLKTISIELKNDSLLVACRNEESEESHDEIAVQYGYNEVLKLNFNINYVRDLLSNSNAKLLQWAFFDNQRSALITVPNEINFKSVLMPLRT